MTFLQNKIRRQ